MYSNFYKGSLPGMRRKKMGTGKGKAQKVYSRIAGSIIIFLLMQKCFLGRELH
jgi:hypothetical protein